MDIPKIAYIANIALMFFMAISLGYLLTIKYGIGWRSFFIGGATYFTAWFLSFIVMGIIQSAVRSFTPSLPIQILLSLFFLLILISIQEVVRYGMYRWWAKDLRSWAEGVLAGAGFGGLEVMLTGLSAILILSQMLSLRFADLSTKFAADQLQEATKMVGDFWSTPWYKIISEAIHSGLTLPIQLVCSILVLQVFIRMDYRWLGYSIGWHTLTSIPFLIIPTQYVYLALGILSITSVISVWLLVRLKPKSEQAIEIAQ